MRMAQRISVCGFVCLSAAFGQPLRLKVDHTRSFIAVAVDKGGLLSFVGGHQHGVLATKWSADVCLDRNNPAKSSAKMVIDTRALRIDSAEARQRAGLQPGGPGAEDIREIQMKMLAPEILDATNHPEIEFHTRSVESKAEDTLVLKGPLTIRGRSRPVSAPAALTHPDNQTFRFRGSFEVKQTEYGIKPTSVAGVVKVKDKVKILFDIYGSLTGAACEEAPLKTSPQER